MPIARAELLLEIIGAAGKLCISLWAAAPATGLLAGDANGVIGDASTSGVTTTEDRGP